MMDGPFCTPERCEDCTGTYCLRYEEPLESHLKKVVMFHAFCGTEDDFDLAGMLEEAGLKPWRPEP
jgi:hypothetical protein